MTSPSAALGIPSSCQTSPAPSQRATQRTRIKICGLTRECDVDAAVEAGADALGFVLYSASPRHVSIERAAELARRLPPFVTPVLLLVNATPDFARRAVAAVPHATLQFHGDESPQDCERAAAAQPWIRAARIPAAALAASPAQGPQQFDLLEYARLFAHARALLLDTLVPGYGGSGLSFDWAALPAHIPAHVVLSGGLSAHNVGTAIATLRPRCPSLGVDVSSGVEATGQNGQPLKGIKDGRKIRDFVAAVRAADAQPGP